MPVCLHYLSTPIKPKFSSPAEIRSQPPLSLIWYIVVRFIASIVKHFPLINLMPFVNDCILQLYLIQQWSLIISSSLEQSFMRVLFVYLEYGKIRYQNLNVTKHFVTFNVGQNDQNELHHYFFLLKQVFDISIVALVSFDSRSSL